MEKVSETINKKQLSSYTDNSRDKSSNTVNSTYTVNSEATFEEKLQSLLEELIAKPEGIALALADLLNDNASVSYYKILVRENSPQALFEIAHYVKEMDLEGKVRTKRAIYFQAILKRRGIKTKFKKEE